MFPNLAKKIHELTNEPDNRKSLDIAIEAANELITLLDPQASNLKAGEDALDENIPVNKFPNFKAESWFAQHPYFTGERVALNFYESSAAQIKFYWLGDTATKARVSAGVMLTPNWEDGDLTRNDQYKVGIDFFLSANTKSLLMVVSNNGNLRILEFNDHLSNTQHDILKNLRGVLALDTKDKIHKTLWDALALNEVNKKFYAGIAEKFNELLNHLVADGKDPEDAKLFASRLLGRLLFIWFLRRKNIIQEQYGYFEVDSSDSTEYYDHKLKKLFFKTLNTPAADRHHADDKTPYLNGGLFEAHDNDWANQKVGFPTGFFNRLYQHLEQYNFTTDESSPEYEQVAIDPEMLGRVFESLLATQVTETGDQARKAKGAFYTPREIVAYMCKESLRQHLYTKLDNENLNEGVDKLIDISDSEWELQHTNAKRNLWGEKERNAVSSQVLQALDSVKILDPACGSGAFPMGMLQLMLKTYERLDGRFDAYKTKLRIVQENIYGVDIEPMAVEISRLRAWLSLVVDDEDDNRVEPLPNLDFKFVCANSLLPLEQQTGLFADTSLHEKLAEVRTKFFNARVPSSKERWKAEYYKLTGNGQHSFLGDQRENQLKSFDPFKNSHPADFFDSDYMFGVPSFDMIIGNPPYVSVWKIKQADKNFYEIEYETARGHYDLYVLFYERSLNSLSANGVLTFITSNKWMAQNYGKALRKLFLRKRILQLLDFSAHQVFESATVDTQITIIRNQNTKEDYSIRVYSHQSKHAPDMNALHLNEINTGLFRQNEELNFKISLTDSAITLINKIDTNSVPLDLVLYTSKGAELHSTKEKIKKEVYIKNENTGGLVNYIEGKYFDKYRVNEIRYLDYQPKKHKAPVFPELFESDKIIVKNVVGRGGIQAILDRNNLYNNDAIINAVPYYLLSNLEHRQVKSALSPDKIKLSKLYSLEFLLAIINSKLSTWYFMQLFANGLHFYPRHLRSIRIPIVENKKQLVNEVEELVKKISGDVASEINQRYISEIDAAVYKLYDLSPEEIDIIENNSTASK